MGFCCLFSKKKRYAYQVGKFHSSYEVKRVLVSECEVCSSRKIKTPDFLSKEYQSFLCRPAEEVIYDNPEERDSKALQYGGGIGVKKLDIFGDKEELEDDEYLLELTYSYGDVEEDGEWDL